MNTIPPIPQVAATGHTAFTVYVDVSHAFQFNEVSGDAVGTPHEPVVRHTNGRMYQRKLIAAADLTGEDSVEVGIGFGPGGIDQILADQQAAIDAGAAITKRTFNKAVAEHIEDAAMRDHALRHHWLRIRVPANKDLETYLNMYFELRSGK